MGENTTVIYGGASWPLSVTIKNESCTAINLIMVQGESLFVLKVLVSPSVC